MGLLTWGEGSIQRAPRGPQKEIRWSPESAGESPVPPQSSGTFFPSMWRAGELGACSSRDEGCRKPDRNPASHWEGLQWHLQWGKGAPQGPPARKAHLHLRSSPFLVHLGGAHSPPPVCPPTKHRDEASLPEVSPCPDVTASKK